MNKEEQECMDILQLFWVKYTQLFKYEEGCPVHRDITVTVQDLQNIQNRILARGVRRNNPNEFSE